MRRVAAALGLTVLTLAGSARAGDAQCKDAVCRWNPSLVDGAVQFRCASGPYCEVPRPKGIVFREDTSKERQGECPGTRIVEFLGEGALVGCDAGEFGGGLWWFPTGGGRREEISQENVHGFVKLRNRVFVLTGLCHMATEYGSIQEFVVSKGVPTLRKFADLPGEPRAWATVAGGFVVLTTAGLAQVRADGTVQRLTTRSEVVDANGMLVTGDTIYVGARESVVRYRAANGYAEEILPAPNCASFRWDQGSCTCRCEDMPLTDPFRSQRPDK